MVEFILYVGTYTNKGSKGIYACRLDSTTGKIELHGTVNTENPSFPSIDLQNRYLYAVNELKNFQGEPTGTISAFTLNPKTRLPAFIGRKPTSGPEPAYVTLDNTGRYVLGANYGGGSVCVFPIKADGNLDDMSSFIQHLGPQHRP